MLGRWLFASVWLLVGSPPVRASDYGCRVLLCLANPADNGGPRGVAECGQTIDRLYRDVHLGRPFPRCDEAGSDSYAVPVFDPYDPCPPSLQPAAAGTWVAPGRWEENPGGADFPCWGPFACRWRRRATVRLVSAHASENCWTAS